jgi:biotin operon repressor
MSNVRNLLATGQSHAAVAKTLGISRQRVGVIAARLRALGADPQDLLQQFLGAATVRDLPAAEAALAALGATKYAPLVPAAQALLGSLGTGGAPSAALAALDGWQDVPDEPTEKERVLSAWASDGDE